MLKEKTQPTLVRKTDNGWFLWGPVFRILSSLKISIVADFDLNVQLDLLTRVKGAVNFFLFLVFKDAEKWTDSSVLIVSSVPLCFIIIVKQTVCVSQLFMFIY